MTEQVVLHYGARQGGKSVLPKVVELHTLLQVKREGKIAVMAAMETGNFDRARMLLTEIKAELPEFGEALELDVVEAYGLTL